MNIKWLSIASGVILILAIIPTWPYAYYILLRWVIFLTSILATIRFYNSKIVGWAFVFGAIAFLFNPLFPVYLTRTAWAPIDMISAFMFFVAGFSKKMKKI